MNYVLDTNVVLYHLAGRLAMPLPSDPMIVSIITEIELLSFKQLTPAEEVKIRTFLSGVTVAGLDSSLTSETVRFRLAGLRLPDAAIAATAAAHAAELWTHDANLLRATGISVVAPPTR